MLAGLAALLWHGDPIELARQPVQLDEATFAAAWAAGRRLTLEQAIAEALGG